jgi:glutamyl/glutaminyl-tRNA synthetase
LPEALVNFLCLLGWSHPEGKEIFSLEEFIKLFDLKDLSPAGPIFNLEKLDWLNGEYIRRKTDQDLAELIKQFLPKGKIEGKLSLVDQTVPLIKTRISKLSDYWSFCSFLFEEPEIKKELFNREQDSLFLQNSLNSLNSLRSWREERIRETLQGLIAKNNWKTGDFFMAFRIALSGSRVTPPITDCAAILGRQTTLSRLEEALKRLDRS